MLKKDSFKLEHNTSTTGNKRSFTFPSKLDFQGKFGRGWLKTQVEADCKGKPWLAPRFCYTM